MPKPAPTVTVRPLQPVRPNAETFEAVKDWIQQNPLRVWRREHGVTRSVLASIVLVSEKTLQNWENGFGMPSKSHLARVFLGDKAKLDKMPDHWKQWQSRRPQVQ